MSIGEIQKEEGKVLFYGFTISSGKSKPPIPLWENKHDGIWDQTQVQLPPDPSGKCSCYSAPKMGLHPHNSNMIGNRNRSPCGRWGFIWGQILTDGCESAASGDSQAVFHITLRCSEIQHLTIYFVYFAAHRCGDFVGSVNNGYHCYSFFTGLTFYLIQWSCCWEEGASFPERPGMSLADLAKWTVCPTL